MYFQETSNSLISVDWTFINIFLFSKTFEIIFFFVFKFIDKLQTNIRITLNFGILLNWIKINSKN